ncbi:MAG: hypothetical protein LBJ36_09575 [Synergistaceae bacterium]|jgi:hypothetical protein|nr:hypothetical protein [Synergistaceae bacterium]
MARNQIQNKRHRWWRCNFHPTAEAVGFFIALSRFISLYRKERMMFNESFS